MPFDGNGNWTSNYYPQSGELIKASDFNNDFVADIANGFGNCVTRDGQGVMQTNTNANNYRVINVADPIAEKDAVNLQTFTQGNNAITGTYTFSTSTGLKAKEPVMTPQNNDLEGGDIIFKGATNDPLVSYDFHVDRQDGNIRIWGYDSNGNTIVPFTVDMKNNRVMMPAYNAMPNYSASVAISNTGSFSATSNGYAFFTLSGGGSETHAYVNGVDVAIGWLTNTYVGQRTCVPMKKGDVLTWDTGRISNPIFVKCIGG